jgi:hypothetical protein
MGMRQTAGVGGKFRNLVIAVTLAMVCGTSVDRPAYAEPRSEISVRSSLSLLPRKTVNVANMGVSAFVNDQRFGTIRAQLREVRQTLGIRHIRVLFAWNDDVQPSPTSPPNFSFYDDIVSAIPSGTDALVIVTGVPSWMQDRRNWIGGNPRATFVELWAKKIFQRYGARGRISSWQIWNEPNMDENPDNVLLEINNSPANYVELLGLAYSASRQVAPRKKVVAAATTAINQDFPDTLQYNEEMQANGAESVSDIWAIHYYGTGFENVIFPGGIASFLNGVTKPIWLTESGAKGINAQRNYVERVWPFLGRFIPGIRRYYLYQFTEATPAESTYGLRNLTARLTVSDLYIYLRDRQAKARRAR